MQESDKKTNLKISLKDIIDSKISEISNLANIKLENKNYKANKISLYQALKTKVDATGFGIIAEIKRKAPSMGDLSSIDDPIALAKEYVKHNAAGISVLTDKTGFNGSIDDLIKIKDALPKTPILRKDFIFHESQIIESVNNGADAILLINSILNKTTTRKLFEFAKNLGCEVLLESHSLNEFKNALDLKAPIIGINNRNLNNFKLDKNHAIKLLKSYEAINALENLDSNYNPILITLSGITDAKQIIKAKEVGFSAALIGSALVNNPELLASLKC